ncbi:MAG: zinc ABC transporter substrate-binding protein, partial [Flavobacteriales bacterium]|nr:zinc ABC transporter substrate-binding protein [Flavobacteriales bacterium]
MHRFIYFILIITALASCRLETETEDRGPLHIVTTTGIIEDGVEHIVQDSAEVTSIMGPGTDPHIYKPTPSDIELMDDADVIIANGLHLEGKMSDMLKQYGEEKPVIFVSDGLAKKDLIKSADFEDSFDPHIWFDWKLWMEGMLHVTQELSEIDTNCRDYFGKNYDIYKAKLTVMDMDVKNVLNSIPEEKRVLITSHDAFSYFGRRYNVEVRGIQGISTLSEVGLKDISDMVDFVI